MINDNRQTFELRRKLSAVQARFDDPNVQESDLAKINLEAANLRRALRQMSSRVQAARKALGCDK
jgi:hypothetical protein